MNYEDIYQRLQAGITAQRLKELAGGLITALRQGNWGRIQAMARRCGLDDAGVGRSRLFARLIQRVHPDKLQQIRQELERLYRCEDRAGLEQFAHLYLEPERPAPLVVRHTEQHVYSARDLAEYGMHLDGEPLYAGDSPDRGSLWPRTFLDALCDTLDVNSTHQLSTLDLQSLEGGLDLSVCAIHELDGVQHCSNLTSLNLNGNRIRDASLLAELCELESLYLAGNCIDAIDFVEGLPGLEELDLSFNQLERVGALLALPHLTYVNLVGNPLSDDTVLNTLRSRGVLVIYQDLQ